jgi:hypothetical protein
LTDDSANAFLHFCGMVIAEAAHEKGREGVDNVKRWLESTLRFEVPYTVYGQTGRVTVPLLDGGTKRYDMLAQHYRDDLEHTYSGDDVWIEVKNVSTAGSARNLKGQFRKFVAESYSAQGARWSQLSSDPNWRFMFVAMLPWEVTHFPDLCTFPFVKEACEQHKDVLGNATFVEEQGRLLAERLWVWIVPRQQDEMTMGRAHVGLVWREIKGGPT